MFHKTSVADFADVTGINVLGTVGVAIACSKVMRDQGFGRIVLVASTAGLYGEPTVSAYAATKGAVIALGRTLAAEGAPRGVTTNVLLPYATTQMTESGMNPAFRRLMTAEQVAPVVSALVDPRSEVNGEVIVTAKDALRAAGSVEWESVTPPSGPIPADALGGLLARSRSGAAHQYRTAQDAFVDFAQDSIKISQEDPR
jgi:NAD(P)-dependent dehydrogenase (short-subunit alcohol dehydrogenase family)